MGSGLDPKAMTVTSAQGRAGRQVGAEEAGEQLCHCRCWLSGRQQVGVRPRAGTPAWCESSASASPWLSPRHSGEGEQPLGSLARVWPTSGGALLVLPPCARQLAPNHSFSLSGKVLLCKANWGFLPPFSEQDVVPAARLAVYTSSNPSVYLTFKTSAYDCTAVRTCFSRLCEIISEQSRGQRHHHVSPGDSTEKGETGTKH